jgi:hypothetical protein
MQSCEPQPDCLHREINAPRWQNAPTSFRCGRHSAFWAFAFWVVAPFLYWPPTRDLLAVCKVSGVRVCRSRTSHVVLDGQDFSLPYARWVVSAVPFPRCLTTARNQKPKEAEHGQSFGR